MLEEAQKKLDEALTNYKTRRIAYFLNKKKHLEEGYTNQLKSIENDIEKIKNITFIPCDEEGSRERTFWTDLIE